MSGHRQAAAALYSLASPDQEGILGQLPVRDQRILRGYLAELAELGFDKAANMAPAPAAAARQDPRTRLREARAVQVFAVVEHEPAVLIAQLLALEDWAWSAELLDMLPPARRGLVRAALEAGIAAAPARAGFLVQSISAQLGDIVPARRAAGLKRWIRWTR